LLVALAPPAFAQDSDSIPEGAQARGLDVPGAFTPQPAKEAMPRFRDLFAPLPGDVTRLVSRHNLFLVAAGSAAALASQPLDARIASAGWGGGTVHEVLEPGRIVGAFPVQVGGALVTYAIGRATGRARVAEVGARVFRAQLVAQATTQAIKLTARRTRPDGSSLSLPSGHTSAAFATASVVQSEFGWKAGIPAYAIASWVAASRVQMDRHYLSDVIAGATIGVLAGRSVSVGRGAARFSVAPAFVPGGVGVSFVRISGR
jgi:membrane-associated phospholipid phosphatase